MLHHSVLLMDQFAVLGMSFLEGELPDFQDLGKIMIGGFLLAIGAAVTFTIVRLRLRNRKPNAPQFISISPDKTRN